MKLVWLVLGLFFLLCGGIGVVLPLIPTVPFLLLAAFCFARSSEKLHAWLLSHSTFGPMIEDWNRSGAIRPTAKRAATISVIAVFSLSLILGLSGKVLIIQAVTLSCVMIFIWTRPNS